MTFSPRYFFFEPYYRLYHFFIIIRTKSLFVLNQILFMLCYGQKKLKYLCRNTDYMLKKGKILKGS